MPKCQFLSLLFLCFRKATQEIFSELDETKAKVPFFPKHDRVQRWDGGCQRSAAPCHGAGHPLAVPGYGVGSWPTLGHSPSANIFPSTGKPKSLINFHETYYKPPPSLTRDREGPIALPGTLPERVITAGGLLHHHACLRSDAWVVYLGLWVHSSS
jgi:hypothetical protein